MVESTHGSNTHQTLSHALYVRRYAGPRLPRVEMMKIYQYMSALLSAKRGAWQLSMSFQTQCGMRAARLPIANGHSAKVGRCRRVS
jgi:hypothetical protein